jgi:predicted nuclease of predicted toxin-antitoxin system
MRFLADENFPASAVEELSKAGHDVAWVRRLFPGMSDPDVLAWAIRESRVLLTFDKDFGELAWAARLPPMCGIILFRTPTPRPGATHSRLAAVIASRDDWASHFSVVEPGRVRMRQQSARG